MVIVNNASSMESQGSTFVHNLASIVVRNVTALNILKTT